MSGKEAMVHSSSAATKCAVPRCTKEANKRGFPQGGRLHRRPQGKEHSPGARHGHGSRYGRQEQEAAWQHAEVDALRQLAAAGVRVPEPYEFHEGVLLMELVADEEGEPAPRLNDIELDATRPALSRLPDPPGGAHAVRRHRAATSPSTTSWSTVMAR